MFKPRFWAVIVADLQHLGRDSLSEFSFGFDAV